MTTLTAQPLDPQTVKQLIVDRDTAETAILDVRSDGTFGDGHLLWANSVPLSTIELDILDRVPRLDTKIVLCAGDDTDDALIERAAMKLSLMGYTDLSYLQDGVKGWDAAGYEIFTGINVPSKAFGEFVEHQYDTPRVSAAELKKMLDDGNNMIVLDSRPMDEYRVMNIPTGIDVPGAELALRVHDLAPDPDTLIVVNCAGRTRSIIGCQSLQNAGIPNKVVALENGTMGWHLAGLSLENGNERTYGSLSEVGLDRALSCAERVRDRFGVQFIDADTLETFRNETGRTTYVFDVRSPEEFALSHIPGARSAPGGQLVQATDRYVGTLGARIICVDDNAVRASMTASWLVQIGWDAYVLAPSAQEMTETGSQRRTLPPIPNVPEIDATALAARMIQTHVVDLDDSLTHRQSHIPGSRFAIRADLPHNLDQLSNDRPITFTSGEGTLAKFAVSDLLGMEFDRDIMALRGGTAAWKAAGLPLKSGFENSLNPAVDVWYRPYDHDDAHEVAMKQYLTWEVNLVRQIERDGTTKFRAFV